MTTTNICRCGHSEEYHKLWPTLYSSATTCAGQSRINEAHPDYEPCDCTSYRPRPKSQETK